MCLARLGDLTMKPSRPFVDQASALRGPSGALVGGRNGALAVCELRVDQVAWPPFAVAPASLLREEPPFRNVIRILRDWGGGAGEEKTEAGCHGPGIAVVKALVALGGPKMTLESLMDTP